MESVQPDGPVVLRTYSDEMRAHHARALLADSGIDAVVLAENAAGMRLHLGRALGVQLMVRGPDARRSDRILQEVEQSHFDVK